MFDDHKDRILFSYGITESFTIWLLHPFMLWQRMLGYRKGMWPVSTIPQMFVFGNMALHGVTLENGRLSKNQK